MRGRVFLFAFCSAAMAMSSNIGNACASFVHSGDSVSIATENALIIWNPEKKTEHFIRGISFQGKGSDFGFIVPTPSVPELGEASQWIYNFLFTLLPSNHPRGGASLGAGPGSGGGWAGGVEEVKHEQVAGFDASVLKASDANALVDWLKGHDYEAPSTTLDWSKPYIKAGYTFSAFKILRTAGSQDVSTKPVRMSFETKTPFYPYREPKHSGSSGRRLGLYVVAPYAVKALYDVGNGTWAGYRQAVVIHEDLRQILIEQAGMKAEDLPNKLVLSYFVDGTENRPDSDVVFVRDLGAKPRKHSH